MKQGQVKNQLKLSEILYEIKINGSINFLKDLFRDPEIKEIVAHTSRRSKCKRSVLCDILEQYVISEYVFDESGYCEERFLNSVRKVLGAKGRLVDYEDEVK
jgi:hypothetical protein